MGNSSKLVIELIKSVLVTIPSKLLSLSAIINLEIDFLNNISIAFAIFKSSFMIITSFDIKSPTTISSILLANAFIKSVEVNTPTTLPSFITGAPSILFSENIFAASFKPQSIFKEITFLLAISHTVCFGMLLIVVVSTSKILSISSLPTISPMIPRLFTGVGPIFIVSPRFKSLIVPSTFIAASHSSC